MARLTIAQIMAQIAATVNQDATSPTAGGTEWGLWLAFINRGVFEWAESGEWEDLRKNYYPAITSGLSNSSIGLPHDFKRLAAPPRIFDASEQKSTPWPIVIPEDLYLYDIPDDSYAWVFGDTSGGFSLQVNPGTLASGASILVPYFSTPTSLASPAEVPICPDSQYLIDRTIAFVFESRSDPRFQEQEQKAREKLLQMVENNNLNKYNSHAGRHYVTNTTRLQGFRLGRD